jgi:AcrR family transcriptional regulator
MANDEHKTARRGEILAAAEKVFSANGYAATTMDAVAAAAGVAKGSLYNYFQSKHELFTQVVNDALSGDEAEVERIIALGESASQKIDRVLDMWAQRIEYFKVYGALMLEFWSAAARQDRSGELASVFQDMYGRWRQRLGRIVTEGVASGEFRAALDPRVAASLIMGMTDGILVQLILGVDLTVDAGFVEAMKKSIRAGLSASAGDGAADEAGENHENTRVE